MSTTLRKKVATNINMKNGFEPIIKVCKLVIDAYGNI